MTNAIRLEYDVLDNCAKCFTEQAYQIEQMDQHLREAVTSLQEGGWMGQSADTFFAELEQGLFPAIRRLSDVLALAGQDTATISQRFRSAEEESANHLQDPTGGQSGGGQSGGGQSGGDQSGSGSQGSGNPAPNGAQLLAEALPPAQEGEMMRQRYDALGGHTSTTQGDTTLPTEAPAPAAVTASPTADSVVNEENGNGVLTAAIAAGGTLAAEAIRQGIKRTQKDESA